MLTDFMQQNKARIIFIGIPILILVIGLGIFFNRPGRVIITAEGGAQIAVATEKSGTFRKVGTGTATYSTRKVPSEVYIEVTKDGKKTVSGVMAERGKTKSVEVKLAGKVNAAAITNNSVSNTYFDGTLGQGIVPDDYTLISFRTDREEPIRPEFVNIPYLKKVVWYDANNFVYNSFKNGVGRFINGRLIEKEGLAASVFGKELSLTDSGEDSEDIVDIKDISRTGNQPLVLMSDSNIFISNDLGSTLRSLTGFKSSESTNAALFTSGNYIYRFAGEDPSAYASESNATKHSKEKPDSTLYQYDYTGKQIAKMPVDAASVKAIANYGKRTYILTPDKLIVSEDGKTSALPLYFTYARDIVTYKDRVVLLGDSGLWQISNDGVSVQLLYEFKQNGVGLAQSFSVSGDSLLFGTQPKPGDTKSSTKMFAIKL